MTTGASINFFAALQGQTEAARHACEVRKVAAMETDAQRSVYLASVYDERGGESYKRLRRDVWELMKARGAEVVPEQEALFA